MGARGLGGCWISSSSSPPSRARRARSAPSPTACSATSATCGLAARRGRHRAERRLDDGEHPRRARADRRRRAALPLRPPRHRAADRRDRAGRRGRDRPQRATRRSSAATTRRPSRRCSRRPGASSPRAARTPGSSSSSPRRRRSGLLGAYAFDHTPAPRAGRLRLRPGASRSASIILGAPVGRSSSTSPSTAGPRTPGCIPEEGRSAIAAAARAIAEMRLGRVDEETTANVGLIEGGTAANIVPEWCSLVAEARSHDERKLAEQVQAMQDAITFAAGVAECEVETTGRRAATAATASRDDLAVRLAADALGRCGFEPTLRALGRRRRRERLQRARPAVRQPRERDGRDPHARRAHRRRRPRGDGRGHARALRRGGSVASSQGSSTSDSERASRARAPGRRRAPCAPPTAG